MLAFGNDSGSSVLASGAPLPWRAEAKKPETNEEKTQVTLAWAEARARKKDVKAWLYAHSKERSYYETEVK